MARNLIRGALLRIASDVTGGTPLESIKARVAITKEGPWEATQNIISSGGGIQALWTGTSARTIEGYVVSLPVSTLVPDSTLV
jgi:hypothetical protein